MIKAVIFDLDGTVIDTEQMWAAATWQMLIARGISYDQGIQKKIHDAVHGLPPIIACDIVKKMFGLSESVEHLAREKSERALSLMKGNIKLISGFAEFHNQLTSKSVLTAIATNCSDYFIQNANQEVGLSHFFGAHLYGITSVNYKAKPDPAIYLYASSRLGLKPEECIAIEDSKAGILAAKNAGMICFGINTADDENNLADADVIISNYHDINLESLGC